MTNNLPSENLEELLAGYVLGNLDEVEITWLNEQLAVNPKLRDKIKELETTLNLIPYALPADVPESDLRSKILATSKPVSAKTNLSFNRLAWIIGTLTTISTVWLGINNYNLKQQIAFQNNQLQEKQALITLMNQPNNHLVSFKGSEKLPTASGSLLIAPKMQKAVLTLQNLKPLSGNQVYSLWAVSNGKKIGCADFTPDENGKVMVEMPDDALNQANSIFITVEPKPDMEQPQGNPMIMGSSL